MWTTLASVGFAVTLLCSFALPACAAGPGDHSLSTSPSGELRRPQTTPAGATATFYYWDHLGTVRMTAGENPTAETVERHDYEPYGLEMLPATNQAGNTHQFTGHERDALGGAPIVALDYMHFRYYGSNLGRFMRPDDGADQHVENPQSWNLFSYVDGNPANLNDPTGHMDEYTAAKQKVAAAPQMNQDFNQGYQYGTAVGLAVTAVVLYFVQPAAAESIMLAAKAVAEDKPTEATKDIAAALGAAADPPKSDAASKKGLITPKEYFGGKTKPEAEKALESKFGEPRSVRENAKTYYDEKGRRSFNVHQEPGHQEGKPHVDVKRRGNYPEKKYSLKDEPTP
jgi:RHS repeat-associated protein